jgi:hypothetical protein
LLVVGSPAGETELPGKGRDRAYRMPIRVLFDEEDLRPIRERLASVAGRSRLAADRSFLERSR